MADSSERYVLLNQLADDFTERSRRGERPTLDEYCAKHPDLADDIRELFPAMVELEDANAATESNEPPPVAEVLGDFRLIREIGRGGMGAVYEAEQISLGRRVALKLLTQRLLRDGKQLRRFEREARSTARLHHTNIVPVHGFGEHDNIPYFVMQYIHGQPLDRVIREIAAIEGNPSGGIRDQASAAARSLYHGAPASPAAEDENHRKSGSTDHGSTDVQRPPSGDISSDSSGFKSSIIVRGRERARKPQKLDYWQGVARIGSQVAQALEYAHGQGVVHRDVKPSNLLLDAASTVWVTDFGLAKADANDNLTTTGDVIGTLRYMAPEALDGRTDARSDVYSLGLTLYEMLALRPAFDQRDRNALIKQVAESAPPRLRAVRPAIPADLETIVSKAIEREPNRRYSTAGELAADLQRFINDEPIRARRQTSFEAIWRWTRQHRAVATLLSAVATLTVTLAVGAFVAAAYYRRQETEQRTLAKAKSILAERNLGLAAENDEARKEAQSARGRAERVVWEMQTARGILAAEADDSARAALWFTSAAKQSPDDATRRAGSLLRARNWLREAHVPLRSFPLATAPKRLEFRPGSDLLLIVTDGKLQVRDWRNDRNLAWASTLTEVAEARFSPDAETIAVAYNADSSRLLPGRFELRNAETGAVHRRFTKLRSINSIAFSGDGRFVAFADDTVRIVDLATGDLLRHEWKHPAAVSSMVFDSKSELLATACIDGAARVFSVADSKKPAPLIPPTPHRSNHGAPPAFVKPGRRLATIGPNAELVVTDVDSGSVETIQLVVNPRNHCIGVVAPPDGSWVAMSGESKSGDFVTVVQPMAPGATKATITHAIWNEDLACSPTGDQLLTASWDFTVRVWSTDSGVQVGSPLPHTEIVQSLRISPDGRHVASFGAGVVRIWRLGEASSARVAHEPWYWMVRPSFDGRLTVPGLNHVFGWFPPVGNVKNEPLRARDSKTGSTVGPPIELQGRLIDCCVTADNRTIAAASMDGQGGWLAFHDAYSGRRRAPPYKLPSRPMAVAPRPDKNEVSVLCGDGSLHSIDVKTGVAKFLMHLQEWRQEKPPIWYADLQYTGGDGRGLVVSDSTGVWIEVRDSDTGALRFPKIRPILSGGPIRSFAVSRDGRYLATIVSGVNAAQVWDARTGASLSKPLLHQGDFYGLWHVAFTPDGERLLTACIDRQALLWDWRKGVLVCPPMKHPDQVYQVEPTSDGRFAMTVSREKPGRLRLWELPSGRQVAPAQQVGERAWRPPGSTLTFTGDGSRVFAGPLRGLSRFDFSEFLSTPAWSADEYQMLAEVAAGQRIEDGHERTLTLNEWRTRLDQLIQARPEFLHPDPEKAAEEYREDSAKLRQAGRIPEALAYARLAVKELERSSTPDPFLLGRANLELMQLQRQAGVETPAEEKARTISLLETGAAARPNDDARTALLADALIPNLVSSWRVLIPDRVEASAGTELALQRDGSLLAKGPVPRRETYTISNAMDVAAITAVRLDLFADPALPQRGPGRAFNGNFVIAEFQAALEESGRSKQVPFSDADWLSLRVASLKSGAAGPALSIDRLQSTFWDLFPHVGVDHSVAFEFKEPIPPSTARLSISIRQGTELFDKHGVGRFRLLWTKEPQPLRTARLMHVYDRASASSRLAIARMLRGEWNQAKAPLENATKVGSLLSWALLDLVLQELGRNSEADAAYEKTWEAWTEVDPSFEEAAIVEEAMKSRLTPGRCTPTALARSFRCRTILGLSAAATEDLERLLKVEPKYPFTAADRSALVTIGNSAAERSDWSIAVAAFDLAIGLDESSTTAVDGAALARLAKGDRMGFRTVCRSALERRRNDAQAAAAFASLECILGDVVEGRAKIVEAVRTIASADPNRAAQSRLAEALCRAGEFTEALKQWEGCDRLPPGAPDPRESAFRAIACLRCGKLDEGRRFLEKAQNDRKAGPMQDAAVSWQERIARNSLVEEAKALVKSAER